MSMGIKQIYKKNTLYIMLLDLGLAVLSFYLAYYLRFDGTVEKQYLIQFSKLWFVYGLLKLIYFWLLSVYRRIWKYATINDNFCIFSGVTATIISLVAAGYFLQVMVPRGVYIITWVLDFIMSVGMRLIPKLRLENGYHSCRIIGAKNSVIIGAGDAGVLVLKEILKQEIPAYNPIGFIDDDANKSRTKILGLPVLGTRKELLSVIKSKGIQEVLIAMPSASGQVIREIVEVCSKVHIPVRTLPRMYDIINGSISIDLIREVKLEDLLGRDPIKLDLKDIEGLLKEKRVLVTGAGGSIGSEICRQVCRYQPQELVLLGHDENPIFEIELELKHKYPYLKIHSIIADVKDYDRIMQVFSRFKSQVVLHAAAHKHVPLMETSPGEAFKNNVIGTKNLAAVADKCGVEAFLFISTDKAVNPTSVMGATKRIAEIIIQDINEKSRTRYAAVRFGNVLGSRGSVIPIFQEQIKQGGPLTVTHPDMERYFMTIPEAVQLVLQAASMANGGEIFLLDMGQPVKILEMAKDFIRLSGKEPEVEIPIKITGMRPGEKLIEELLTSEEGTTVTRHERIFVAHKQNINITALTNLLNEASLKNYPREREEVFAVLNSLENRAERKKCVS